MKHSVYFLVLLLLVISIWSLGPSARKVEALTVVNLTSPGDSTKVTTATPSFKWQVVKADKETPRQFQIRVADNLSFTSPVWEDTNIVGTATSIAYGGSDLVAWKTYFWTMNVEIDSQTATGIKTYWQEDFSAPNTFFYTTATLFDIRADGHGDLPNIQTGIVWAAQGDTVLVEPGTYPENLYFNKSNLLLTSRYAFNPDTAIIDSTVINGSNLTRGKDNGSVVFFTSGVDSSSRLIGFTLRGGTGTAVTAGTETRICGGGIYCNVGSSPTITNNVIVDNHVENDGGGIYINSAAPNIFNNIITSNSTQKGSGGGIESAFSIPIPASTGLSPRKQNQDEIKKSLNPEDGTQIALPTAFNLVTNAAAGDSPVAVVTWEARKDTIIHRDKFLPGDTIIFSGTGSYDPKGDSISVYQWNYYQDTLCGVSPTNFYSTITGCDNSVVCTLAIDNSWRGMLRVGLQVITANSPRRRGNSVLIPINVQYPPHVAGKAVNAGPGDTLWLDGSGSCDINPSDILTYQWTQDSGVVMPVEIHNSDSAKAYFIPADSTWVGRYKFRLKISDSMDSSSVSVRALVAYPPIAICKKDPVFGDTLVGFTISDTLTLDGTSSYDRDLTDPIKYYLWQPVAWYFVTSNGLGSLSLSMHLDSTKAVQKFTFGQGGLLKFRLRVKDSFGVLSQNYDSVYFSVQLPPVSFAGKDTILVPGTRAYLHGTALELNPDQRSSLAYHWEWKQSPTIVSLNPSNEAQSVYFDASLSGIYRLELRVQDPYTLSNPSSVRVVANLLPKAVVANVLHAFEGDSITLDGSASYDPDASTFGGPLKYNWSVAPDGVPAGAETPSIVNATQSIAKFVPYGTGIYKFQLQVDDTISVHQPPDTNNIAILTVKVDSTYAYPIIQGNLIANNYSGGKGGGLDCNKSSAAVINNIFYKNQSVSSGGAISCRNFSTPEIKSNIFFGNLSADSTGGAISDLKGVLAPAASRGFRKYLTIKYNDFWDNRGGMFYQTGGDTAHNIYSYPRLIDPDFGNFSLDCTSPCWGKGDPDHPDIGSLIYFQPCKNSENLSLVELSLFQNPAATAVAHFLVNTDAPLKANPVAYVNMGENAPSPVYFTSISSNSFRGSYIFASSGTAHITIIAKSLLERDTTAIWDFSVQLIAKDQGGTLFSVDKRIGAIFSEGTVKENFYATCIAVTEDSRYRFEGKPDAEAIGPAYQLGPSVILEKDITINFPLDPSVLKDKTCFSLYGYEDGRWNQVESYLDGNSVYGRVKNLGIYRLIYDPSAKRSTSLPKSYELFQNSPNPFNPETQIKYDLPSTGLVQLMIYNILGQNVKVLVNEVQEAGHRSVTWDGKDDAGKEVASGIYFYKLQTGHFENTKKMVFLK